ncbi:MAG: hypothetical protein A3G80_01815 [Betaproteobacteria bacterium RIFCSPLOWO2_12_FULL_62_13b]|nr:MAG: hypothetical protein A3G80_01815 [Betaproteobacteria bacterium RIFCSPLOWO2_12_FULL_62_13b]
MRYGDCARLFAVIHKVALCVERRVLADDLHRVLGRADSAVRAQTVEHRTGDIVGLGVEILVHIQRQTGDVIDYPDGEMTLGLRLRQFVQGGLGHCRRVLLGRQAVAAAYDFRRRQILRPGFDQGGDDVLIHGLADRARLLGAVEHGDGAHAARQRRDEGFGVERPVQPHGQEAHFLTARGEGPDRFAGSADAGTHLHQHPLGIGGALVIEQPVVTMGEHREPVHGLLHDARYRHIEQVARFARLEKHVRILRRAAQHGLVRVERARAMRRDQFFVDQLAHLFLEQQLELVYLVAGAKSVEKMHERNARTQCRHLRDHGHVLRLLHAGGGEHGPAGGPRGHHVAVVAEDGQRVGGHSARRDVEHRGRKFARDLEHVGEH